MSSVRSQWTGLRLGHVLPVLIQLVALSILQGCGGVENSGERPDAKEVVAARIAIPTAAPASTPPQRFESGGGIHGTILADLGENMPAIPLAGISVNLIDERSNRVSATVLTDDFGRYTFRRQSPGTYKLSWVAPGFEESAESREPIVVRSETRFPDPIFLTPSNRDRSVTLYGTVSLEGDDSPWFSSEFFDVEQRAEVVVTDPAGSRVRPEPTRTNASGEFVVTGLPRGGMSVSASLWRRSGESGWKVLPEAKATPVNVSAEEIEGKRVVGVSPKIQTRRPSVAAVPTVDGRPVEAAQRGKWVECPAVVTGGYGDEQFRWKVPGYEIQEDDKSKLRWQAPQESAGMLTAYVLASSEAGGLGIGQVSFEVAPATVFADNAGARRAPGPPRPADAGFGFLMIKGPGNRKIAENYYEFLNKDGRRSTLGGWFEKNGFEPNGKSKREDYVHIAYANNNDLGFGRDVHFLQIGKNVAAYVTNYGEIYPPGATETDPLNADRAHAADVSKSKATVCMEYSPVEGLDPELRIVKFFVYQNGTPKAKLIPSANLDGYGEKFVPNLCLNCHGGEYEAVAGEIPNIETINSKPSSFREFDLATYRFARTNPRDDSRTNPRDDLSRRTPTPEEERVFNRLNDLVCRTSPKKAIRDLVAGWAAQGSSWVPRDWNDPSTVTLYRNVVARSCRTCHVALPGDDEQGGNAAGLDWTSFAQFSTAGRQKLIKKFVFYPAPTRRMPHARVTYENFRRDGKPSIVGELCKFRSVAWSQLGDVPGLEPARDAEVQRAQGVSKESKNDAVR